MPTIFVMTAYTYSAYVTCSQAMERVKMKSISTKLKAVYLLFSK